MNMYFHGERISGWNCPGCKQKRDAVKKLDISKWPPILAIHFKRLTIKINFNMHNIHNFSITDFMHILIRECLIRRNKILSNFH